MSATCDIDYRPWGPVDGSPATLIDEWSRQLAPFRDGIDCFRVDAWGPRGIRRHDVGQGYAGDVDLLQPERTFQPYGPSHWVMIVVLVAGSLVLVRIGRRYRPETVRRHARWFAVALVAFAIPLLIIRLVPPNWNLYTSLPIHLCDLAWMAAAYALWTQRPWAYAVTYYWGLTLTPQAIVTPALDAGFPHLDFVAYWGQHLLIVWAAVYLTWVVGLRPDWRGYWIAIAITAGWMVAMLAFNAWAGTNYGYFSRKPDDPTLLDLLGGWPWYIGAEVVACGIGWALLTWPWTKSERRSGSTGAADTGTRMTTRAHARSVRRDPAE